MFWDKARQEAQPSIDAHNAEERVRQINFFMEFVETFGEVPGAQYVAVPDPKWGGFTPGVRFDFQGHEMIAEAFSYSNDYGDSRRAGWTISYKGKSRGAVGDPNPREPEWKHKQGGPTAIGQLYYACMELVAEAER